MTQECLPNAAEGDARPKCHIYPIVMCIFLSCQKMLMQNQSSVWNNVQCAIITIQNAACQQRFFSCSSMMAPHCFRYKKLIIHMLRLQRCSNKSCIPHAGSREGCAGWVGFSGLGLCIQFYKWTNIFSVHDWPRLVHTFPFTTFVWTLTSRVKNACLYNRLHC